MSPLFQAKIKVTEDAIHNSLCMAETMTGFRGRTGKSLPLDDLEWLAGRHKL